MLRLAILTELYPPSVGGQEAFFEGIARALVRRGHQVDVVCIGHRAGLQREETVDGVSIVRAPVDARYQRPPLRWMKRRWLTIGRYAMATRRIARRGEHDFYILNEWPLLHLALLPRSARRRALAHWCEVREGAFYRIVQERLPRMSRLNAAISEPVADAIHQASGKDIFVLPSGLDLDRYVTLEERDRADILCLGRIAEHKNIPLLIDAFERLKDGGYGGRLIIAGDGSSVRSLRERVARSPFGSQIDLPGLVGEEEKLALLGRARVLAMPSRREGFPRVVAEAMASGLPVVTADFSENGTRHIVSASGCGVVSGSDPESFARAVLEVGAGWRTYSEAGLVYARTLGWDAIAHELEAQILSILDRQPDRPKPPQ